MWDTEALKLTFHLLNASVAGNCPDVVLFAWMVFYLMQFVVVAFLLVSWVWMLKLVGWTRIRVGGSFSMNNWHIRISIKQAFEAVWVHGV